MSTTFVEYFLTSGLRECFLQDLDTKSTNNTGVDNLKETLCGMQVADLLLPLGIYFGSSQVQSSKVLNICQGLGLVLFSTDHSVLWNSWKIRLNDIYCLFVNLSRLGS